MLTINKLVACLPIPEISRRAPRDPSKTAVSKETARFTAHTQNGVQTIEAVVAFGNYAEGPGFCPGDVVVLRPRVRDQPWVMEIFEHRGLEIILVPVDQIVGVIRMVDTPSVSFVSVAPGSITSP